YDGGLGSRAALAALALSAIVTDGCARPPVELAARLAAADVELSARLRPAPGAWLPDGARVSPAWRNGLIGGLGVRLPDRADGELAVGPGAADGYTLALTAEGARAVALDEHDGRALYAGAFPSTDVIFTVDQQRLEWFLVLRDRSAPSELKYRVRLPARLPSVVREPSGALAFADRGGTARLRIPRPFA